MVAAASAWTGASEPAPCSCWAKMLRAAKSVPSTAGSDVGIGAAPGAGTTLLGASPEEEPNEAAASGTRASGADTGGCEPGGCPLNTLAGDMSVPGAFATAGWCTGDLSPSAAGTEVGAASATAAATAVGAAGTCPNTSAAGWTTPAAEAGWAPNTSAAVDAISCEPVPVDLRCSAGTDAGTSTGAGAGDC